MLNFFFYKKVCEICGAMQAINDTEKRTQIHLEGKLHTGFAVLRKELDKLRKRKEEIKNLVHYAPAKEKKKSVSKESKKTDKKAKRSRSRSRSKDDKKRKHRERSRSRSHHKNKKHRYNFCFVEFKRRSNVCTKMYVDCGWYAL